MSDFVTVDFKNYVASVKLNRPEKHNALSWDMFQAIIEAGQMIAADNTVRAVVISGQGRSFCAGLDFKNFMQLASAEKSQNAAREKYLFKTTADNIANFPQQVAFVWKQMSIPVIAALHGVAFGGGLQLALGADIRLAAPDARFSVMEIKWGLVPDMSGTQTMRDLVRLDVAKELTFSGRVLEAEEALRLGLITRICDNPLNEAEKMAREIAEKSPDAIAAGKQLLEKAWRGTTEEGLRLEATMQSGLIGSPNQVEAVMANFENRSPNFKSRT